MGQKKAPKAPAADSVKTDFNAADDLEDANRDLETKVEKHTAELKASNKALVQQIEQRKKAEEIAGRRESILQAVSYAAELFFKNPFSRENAIKALERLGQAADVSRVTVYENTESGLTYPLAKLRYAWYAPGTKPTKGEVNLSCFDPKKQGVGQWAENFAAGKNAAMNSRNLKSSDKKFLKAVGLKSLLGMPIFVEGDWWGVLSLGDNYEDRDWSEAEKEAAITAANILGSAISRSKADSALEESRRTMATLLGNLPGMAYRRLNKEGWPLKFASEGCFELTGFMPNELVDNPRWAYNDVIHPDDRQMVWNEVQKGLASKKMFRSIYRIRTARREKKWVLEQGCGIFEESGEAKFLEGFIMDITDRREMELKLMENTREIELYNDILAHDIGNINQTTLANLHMLLSEDFGKLNKDQKTLLQACQRQVRRTNSLIEKVKTVSQMKIGGPEDLGQTEIGHAVSMALEMVRMNLRDKELIVNFTPRKRQKVVADPLLIQLLMNVFENSVNHSKKATVTVDMKVDLEEIDDLEFWRISIADDGPGIRDDLKKVIFNRFEKGRKRKGSGIGLAIVKALAAKYNGWVFIEDKVKDDHTQGTKIVVVLPKA